jgi:hypothetical protein
VSDEARINDLEREVARLKEICAPFTGDGSLTGRIWKMDWGTLEWGKDGFQLVQNENVQDCPEIGFTTWQGNSLGKICGRVRTRDGAGHVSSNELVLQQFKRETGSSQHANSDIEGGKAGLFWVGCNDGGGSEDKNMKVVVEAMAHAFDVRVPGNVGAATPQGNGDPGALKSRNGKYWLVIQDDGNYVLYKNKVPYDYNTGVAYWSSGTVQS